MNELSLCTGIGAMQLGLKLAAPSHRTICYVEREAFCVEHLVAKMQSGALDAAPVWSDLGTFDGRPWRGVVDLVSASLPCQPFSVAGKRLGETDDRHLWPHAERIIRECEPSAVFLENVAASAFRGPHAGLLDLGFHVHPPYVATASHFGAPHIRERWFVLATHPQRPGLEVGGGFQGDTEPQCAPPERGDRGSADTECGYLRIQPRGIGGASGAQAAKPGDDGPKPPDPYQWRQQGERRGWLLDPQRQTLRHDTHRCGDRCRICGTPWADESPVLRVDDGSSTRVDELRAIGNAVVPLVVAHAFRTLALLSHFP